ncbi:Lytic transglycosylase catalytic [Gemmatirosa kalamazoonensis]|uniref:Lytic transglycosylase catalytic n=1 Tax=Gemmatirosa kalamazoonensis TaxID=861299 RepID=W0RCR3_9BACT|nr:lytic transglycosylase domain-containing protein [Gemmatirosa kalamazoonensis]AHG88591.1 Lytic transglycosylase catalytic [Gemmatirosa kalamazoonensis]
MRLTRRAMERGAPASASAYRALYPWPWQPLVRESARARDMDPALVAAVIRQESSFTPGATSAVGAVGLMQIMPPVGRSLWDALGTARAGVPWAPALLRQPDVSVALGTRHLASSLAAYPDVAYALAAYNAGGTPVARWRRRAGTADPELFVERIPYDETRDYVRIVSRNRAFYSALYAR